MMHGWAAMLLSAAALALWVRSADAQLYPALHRPSGVSYYNFQTPHFHLIYQDRLVDEAFEVAALLERVYPEVRTAVGLRRSLNVPVILNHYTDRANAFLSPWPFRQEIEAVNLRGKSLSPRFPNWFETAVPHELAHAVHAESGHGFGVGWILRQIGPDLARSLNLSGPRGMNEGVAVWMESRLHQGAGRLNYSLFEMQFRAAMVSGDPWSLAQMLERPSYSRPFDRYYMGGGHLFEYLVDKQGIDFFHRTRTFYYRFPLLGYAPALWYGTGMMPHVLGRRIRAHFQAETNDFVEELGEITEVETIASEKGAVFRRPRWLDDRTLVVYSNGYNLRPGFYRIDSETGTRDAIAHESITEDTYFTLSKDAERIYFSRYVPSTFAPAQSIAEVFRVDVASGDARRLTVGGRAYGAVEGGEVEGERGVWALENLGQFNRWVTVRGEPVGSLARTTLVAIEPSPNGERVALVANHEGMQGIYEAVLEEGQLVDMDPWVVPAEASVYDASWSPDGEFIVFSADPGGVANIYAYEVRSGRTAKLTNAAFGAIEPSVSPDGRWLAYVNYRHERYELVRIPFAPLPKAAGASGAAGGAASQGRAREDAAAALGLGGAPDAAALRIVRSRGDAAVRPGKTGRMAPVRGVDDLYEGAAAEERRGSGPFSPKPYRALSQVRPRVLYPFLVYQRKAEDRRDVSLGFGGGVGVEWTDPLKAWTAHTSAYYQHEALWGRMAVQSGYTMARPRIELHRSPSTVSVRMRKADGVVDTVRVGRDERGIGAGVQTPFVLQSNVFQTNGFASLMAEYRQERLFGRENETLRPADDRLTVSPAVRFAYRVQQNTRDLVPNSGMIVTAISKVDLWAESGREARWIRADGRLHIPLLQQTNTGIQVQGRLLAQNRGGVVDLSGFFPRGYETTDAFLGNGTFATYGLEVTQPLLFVDDGLFLIPIYVKAVFAYGFLESMQQFGNARSTERLSVAGAGLGVQLRVAHTIDLTLRVAPVYKFATDQWGTSLR